MEMQSRELLEIEQKLLAKQRTDGVATSKAEVLRGAEDAMTWVLAGRISPAPLTGIVRDPTNGRDLRVEAERAEEVWFGHGANDPTLSDKARSGNVSRYANGVSKTLAFACGSSEDDAFGRDEESLLFHAEELAGPTP